MYKEKPNGAKDRGGISSRFSIAWWFCRFLARRRRWCSLWGGRRLKWQHLRREKQRSDSSHQDAAGGGIQIWVYLCDPVVSARSPSSAGSRCKPCCPRSPTRSTAGDRFSFAHHKHPPPKSDHSSKNSAYLPTGDREIGKYAVLLVLMARVGFQALSHSKRNDFLKLF